ncbi:pectinesterase inhibitor-like [Coffea eugenioides]|uniref:pectinesterase inhibitor-like n=1 Tax=Coffea eugenioides TaxID=49369 RepID=UPI000F6048DA|nr:pectinesterase inhibitor-like [Coffea eugenioides]
MEFSRSHSPLLLALFFICLSILSNLFTSAEADLISDFALAQNPQFCINSLRSDRRSGSADLKGLGQIAIDLTTRSAKSTKTLVDSLKQHATDTRLKGIYDSCSENYGDSIDDLGEATSLLKSGDYLGVNLRASAALDGADTCDDNFKDAKLVEPRNLADASQNVQNLCEIILIIANRLGGNI